MARRTLGWIGLGSITLLVAACSAIPGLHGLDGHTHDTGSGTPVAVTGNGTVNGKVISYKADVVPMLRTHCASCHVPGGGVPTHAYWFDAAGQPQYQTIKDHAGVMILKIRTGEMPKGAPNSVPPQLVEELDAWRKAGAPQN